MKVRGQYHMKRRFTTLPEFRSGVGDAHIALIGCGNFAYSNLAFYLRKFGRSGRLRAAMDVDIHRAASLATGYGLAYYTDNVERIIADPTIDFVFIASNHASHAEYAIRCIEAGKHVHIEKPHVVSQDQLDRLMTAVQRQPMSRVFLGFNRPRSRLFRELQALLALESGPLMINWFIAGHEIPDDHWYFDVAEGGRVLGNLCHWTDLTLQLVGLKHAFPCTIIPATPMGAKSDFVVSVIFADRSCASITFSAKGHTFEGVREVLNVHKGNVLANLTDFETLSVDIVSRRIRRRLLYRDHGHEANVEHSVLSQQGESPGYIKATARFFLAIRDAIERGETVYLDVAAD